MKFRIVETVYEKGSDFYIEYHNERVNWWFPLTAQRFKDLVAARELLDLLTSPLEQPQRIFHDYP